MHIGIEPGDSTLFSKEDKLQDLKEEIEEMILGKPSSRSRNRKSIF